MEFFSLTPNLMVKDVTTTIGFYESVLGFTLLQTVPSEGNPDWAMMKRGDIIMMFQTKKSLSSEIQQFSTRQPGGGMTLYIKMSGVREFYNDIVSDVEIIAELEDTFYDTCEFSIMDMNGYVLTFSEENTTED